MKPFFDKHHTKLTEHIALDMMEDEMEKAIADKEAGGNYRFHLACLHEMIEDYFDVKGTKPAMHRVDN